MLAPPQFALVSRSSITIEKWEAQFSSSSLLNAWRLEDVLDVPSYGEPLGEAILQRMRKLESKRRLFSPLQNRYDHAVPAKIATR